MRSNRPVRVLAFAGVTVFAALGAGGMVSAQEDGTTTTTQLDLEQDEQDGGSTTTTTQLDVQEQDGESTTTTQLQIAGDTATGGGVEPPTRVDAGAGGAAGAEDLPLASLLLAGGLVVVTGATAVRMRRSAGT